MWFKRISVGVTDSSDTFACLSLEIKNYEGLVYEIEKVLQEHGITNRIGKVKLWRSKTNEYVWYTPTQIAWYLDKTKKTELKAQIELCMKPVKSEVKEETKKRKIEPDVGVLQPKKLSKQSLKFRIPFEVDSIPRSRAIAINFNGCKLG